MNYLELLRLSAPEAILTLTALVVLTIGLTSKGPRLWCFLAALVGLVVSAVTVLLLPGTASLFHGMLVISPLNSLFKVLCLGCAFFTVLLAYDDRSFENRAEYLGLLLLGTVGLMLLVGSEELLMIFIALELTGLSLYVLTAFDKRRPGSAEAGLKYFLFGSTASAFTLFGLSLIYGATGTTSLAEIAPRLTSAAASPLLAAGVVMSLIGFSFKIAAAPFHLWAPDAYQGGPVPSAAFIASGSKVASFVVLGKLVLLGFAPVAGTAAWHGMIAGWSPILALLAAFSIVIGNLVALVQTNLRRLLAYSAVAHGGYTLLGLVAGGRAGFAATLFYTTIYALTLLGAFAVVAAVRRTTGGDNLINFAGLAAHSPLLAGCLTIFILSLAGLPPLPGFFGKFYLFAAALQVAPSHGLLWLVALALFGSLISLYYYLVVLKLVFSPGTTLAEEQGTPPFSRWRIAPLQGVVLILLAAAVLLVGLLPNPLAARILAALP